MNPTVIGWLPGEPLLPAVTDALAQATLVFGAKGFAPLAERFAPNAHFEPFEAWLAQLPERCARAIAQGERVVVATTGDPLFHGAAAALLAHFGPDAVTVLPERSSVQLACARLGIPWHNATLVSAHGKVREPWSWKNAPHHPLRPVLVAAAHNRSPIVALTAPGAGATEIASALTELSLAHRYRISVAARIGLDGEALWRDLEPSQAAATAFPHPHIAILTSTTPGTEAAFGWDDDAYAQRQPEKGLITKREVRAVALALLALTPHDTVWDIGAGSGSVGLEAARLTPEGAVWAFEKNADDVAIALTNARRFHAANWTIRHTKAPAGLEEAPDPNAVFIGGSGGELAELLTYCWQRIAPGGRLVATFVTLENLATATAAMTALDAPWHATQLWAARTKPILAMHRFAAENPVWLVAATKEPS